MSDQPQTLSDKNLTRGVMHFPTSRKFWGGLAIALFSVWICALIALIWFWAYRSQENIVAAIDPTPSTLLTATPSPLPLTAPLQVMATVPLPTPPATRVVAVANYLTQAQTALVQAQTDRSEPHFQTALTLLAQVDALDPALAAETGPLRAQVLAGLDTLSGTVYLPISTTESWLLRTNAGVPLIAPIDLTSADDGLYLIDCGTLYRVNWPATTGNSQLAATPVLTPGALISGYPLKEIVAVEAANTGGNVFVLDKANDIYQYQAISGTWQLQIPAAAYYTAPDPLFLNLSSYAHRLYILDPARNQIWRYPPNESGEGYLPGTLPWQLAPGEPDINAAIDLTIDGNIYTLQRDGVIVTYSPAETHRFSLTATHTVSHIPGWNDLPVHPAAILASIDRDFLYVTDPGHFRVVILSKTDGRLLRQLVAPDNPDFATVAALAEHDGFLYILAGPHLYRYPLAALDAPPPLTGSLPAPITSPAPTAPPGSLLPNDPRWSDLLAAYHWQMPLTGAQLPDRGAIYPGSRRVYRYGVHEGLDLYGKDVGIDMTVGTPVYAAAAGTVLQADWAYQEMTLAEVNGLLDDANARHITPPETMTRLNGRQVWLDHGGGVVTRYSHLSAIAEGLQVGQPVASGQLIGYVGLSGTPDGISGNTQFPHLHFEMRLGDNRQYYLGQWLTIEQTRRLVERLFNVPVRPAYLEFK